jgi:hypothetical protein
MAEHLSELQLDEIAVGQRQPGEHAASCAECRSRLERRARQREEIARAPEFEQTFQRLARKQAERHSMRRPWLWLAPAAVAAAAAVLLVVVPRAPSGNGDGDRIKGAPRLSVVAADGRGAASYHVGDRVFLSAAGAGLDHLVVFSRGEGGALERVWPVDSSKQPDLSADGAALLQPAFEVTPGDVALLGVFSRERLDADQARRILESAPDQGTDTTRMGAGIVVVRQMLRVEGDRR